MTTSPETCAELMLFALLDVDKGVYRWDDKGYEIGMKGFSVPEGDEEKKDQAQKALWDPSLQAPTV